MLNELSFELKTIGIIIFVGLAFMVFSIEMRASNDPSAPNTLELLHRAYDNLAERVEQNIHRSPAFGNLLG